MEIGGGIRFLPVFCVNPAHRRFDFGVGAGRPTASLRDNGSGLARRQPQMLGALDTIVGGQRIEGSKQVITGYIGWVMLVCVHGLSLRFAPPGGF